VPAGATRAPQQRQGRLTAQSSARWANAIIGANDEQYRPRDAQRRHIIGLRAAIATLEKRLAAPTGDTLTTAERTARRSQVKGHPTKLKDFGNSGPVAASAGRTGAG
jgi:hypothetical protein